MPNGSSLDDLHVRYQHQATWTAQNRSRLYEAAGLDTAKRILEVGSGTGVITSELCRLSGATVIGLDIDHRTTTYARTADAAPIYVTGDGFHLPFADSAFDAAMCHFPLLWVVGPEALLSEMVRVTATRGAVLALAEPDYGGRIDYPEELIALGAEQSRALAVQGADVRIGRKLRKHFSQLGLWDIQVGLLGGEWPGEAVGDEQASEWSTLVADLADHLSIESLNSYRRADAEAWSTGSRILFVPTFYAIGFVPSKL